MWKRYAIVIAAIIAVGVIPSILTQANGEEPISVKRYRDYQVAEYSNGLFTQTLGMPEYVWNGTQYVDRIIQNNGSHFNVYSEMGSFSFNKSSCTITQYTKGFDPTSQAAKDSDIMVKEWFWTVARKNGSSAWNIIDASQLGCSITTHQNATGKYLTMIRTDLSSGSYLKVELAAPDGKPVEDFAEFYMNRAAWSGNKFAFVIWAKNIHADTILLRNGTQMPIRDGSAIIDRSQLSVDALKFIRDGNAFFVDWQKAAPQFKTMMINKTGGVVDVYFGFNNNAPTLSTGQKMNLDPTYGYTSATQYGPQANLPGAAGASCNAANYAPNAGGTAVRKRASGTASECSAQAWQWNVASIPDTAYIVNSTVRFDVSGVVNGINCDLTQVTVDITTATGQQLWEDVVGISSDVDYVSNTSSCTTNGNDKVVDLGSTFDTYLKNTGLPADRIAVGLWYNDQVRDASAHAFDLSTTNELQVTYVSSAPAAPTGFSATSIARAVSYIWSASVNATGSNGVTTYYHGRSLDNATWTNKSSFGNVTAYFDAAYYRPGLLYFVNLTASNGLNSSSAFTYFYMDTYPTKPLNPYTTQLTATSTKVNWQTPASSGNDTITGYRVQYSPSTSCISFSQLVNSTNTLNYNQTGQGANIQHCYRVAAWNGVGLGPWSDIVKRFTMPDAVLDLISTARGITTIDISWTAPDGNGLSILGYMINYTTPTGTPVTVLVNFTNNTATSYAISGLTADTDYSIRVGPWTYAGINGSGNILDAATFGTANFTIGFFDVNATNPDIFPIRFQRTEINATATQVKVIYPNTADLDCTLYYQLAQTSDTYSSISGSSYDSDSDYEDFVFRNAGNDVIDIDCIDNNTNDTGRYQVQQEGEFPLLDMIRSFRNGDYGTMGMIGSLDLITMMVVIVSMIGFNRVNESVGVVFNTFLIGALAWFEIIEYPQIMYGALFLIAVLTYLSTRKD